MAKKLQLKFVIISLISASLVLILALAPIDAYIYVNHFQRLHYLSDMIINNDGRLPDFDDKKQDFMDNYITAESRNEIRYFSVTVSNNGNVEDYNTWKISVVSDEEATSYALEALENVKNKNGIFQMIVKDQKEGTLKKNDSYYYYKIRKEKNGQYLIVFLDGTSSMNNVKLLRDFTIALFCVCFLLFMLLVRVFSRRAIRSFVENYEKQKSFITNASHELKTPLAIISANTEVVEMMDGESEWTNSIKNQIKRMTELINDLVSLAKAEEKSDVIMEEFNFSEIVSEQVNAFKPVIENSGKKLVTNIDEGITIKSDKKGLTEVVSVLVDNAAKYCDDDGTVTVKFRKKGRKTMLTVANSYEEGANVDYNRFFDRFYREDESHNSAKKGYGIGLSLAEATVNSCKGKISVSHDKKDIIFTVIV